ncbi:TMEM175 family protein [Roseibacterium beibuensis]|uniref:TMEM175 family protein n=1 Tax=[Roseibacterium] beibuensis TaxID=1193142 RepID=UPI00217E0C8B|nr:TMEM175 family protein [Roseibacterium beibuensis]MCS6624581.1 TMEM175 family protein [Roseibacterium beibuensis]
MGDGTGTGPRFRPADEQRLDAFVDAAFAFAVSLLIIAGGEPLRSFDDLVHALLRIPSFLAGFALIVLFWLAHRAWSSLGPKRDSRATLLSLAIVFAVLVFVFPLRLLTETALHFMSGGRLPGGGLITSFSQLGWTYAIYGFGFSILSVLYVLLFRQGRTGLAADDPRLTAANEWARVWTLAAVTGVASGAAALSPLLPAAPWLPGFTYWIMPVGIWAFAFMDRRRMRRLRAG